MWMYAHVCVRMRASVLGVVHMYMGVPMCNVFSCTGVCIYVYMCAMNVDTDVWANVCAFMYMCVYTCVHI